MLEIAEDCRTWRNFVGRCFYCNKYLRFYVEAVAGIGHHNKWDNLLVITEGVILHSSYSPCESAVHILHQTPKHWQASSSSSACPRSTVSWAPLAYSVQSSAARNADPGPFWRGKEGAVAGPGIPSLPDGFSEHQPPPCVRHLVPAFAWGFGWCRISSPAQCQNNWSKLRLLFFSLGAFFQGFLGPQAELPTFC